MGVHAFQKQWSSGDFRNEYAYQIDHHFMETDSVLSVSLIPTYAKNIISLNNVIKVVYSAT